MRRLAIFAVAAALTAAGCGVGVRGATRRDAPGHVHRAVAAAAAKAATAKPPLQALVTAQTENRLLIVALPSGRVRRAVAVPGEPGYVDATHRIVVVVSSDPGAVTLLDRKSLHVIKTFHGFSSPHIPAVSPDGRYAYVTDDASGQLAVIDLDDHKLLSRIFVGPGAHHLAFSPDEREVWVALSQSAQTLTLLSTVSASGAVDPGRPRVVGHFDPPFLAHDLLFAPGGKQVWVTSASTSYVGVFSTRSRRMLFRVPAGAPPQHLAFAGGYAYVTSGYGSSIEQVSLDSGRVVRKVHAPYGSFDLDASRGYVVTASLLEGTLAIYNHHLRLLRVVRLAPSTEDVALSRAK